MLTKGRENATWEAEEVFSGEDRPTKKGETRWYDTINYDLFKPPFCIRPKGKGIRFDFSSFGNLQDKALEIKEAAPYKFKHTGDVHRNAHYIGMYILETLHVKNKKFTIQDDVEALISAELEKGHRRKFYRDQFSKLFEQYVIECLTMEALIASATKIAESIEDEDLRSWFVDDCEKKLNNKGEADKVKRKIYMRDYRVSARDLGLSVISQ